MHGEIIGFVRIIDRRDQREMFDENSLDCFTYSASETLLIDLGESIAEMLSAKGWIGNDRHPGREMLMKENGSYLRTQSMVSFVQNETVRCFVKPHIIFFFVFRRARQKVQRTR